MTQAVRPLRADIDKYYRIHFGTLKPPFGRKFRLWLNNFGLHCVVIYRMVQAADRFYRRNKLLGIPFLILALFINLLIRVFYHVEIQEASIGPGFYIGHIGTIIIGPCNIGSDFSINHNITIGYGHTPGQKGIPEIGDSVWIGTGAVLSGQITIGRNVTIAPGCMLSRSVPDGSLVAGNPGRVVRRDYDNSGLMGRADDSSIG